MLDTPGINKIFYLKNSMERKYIEHYGILNILVLDDVEWMYLVYYRTHFPTLWETAIKFYMGKNHGTSGSFEHILQFQQEDFFVGLIK